MKLAKIIILIFTITLFSCTNFLDQNSTPATPSLAVNGDTLFIRGTDPDGDKLAYQIELTDPGNQVTENPWTGYMESGVMAIMVINIEIMPTVGDYTVRVRCRDEMNEISAYSNSEKLFSHSSFAGYLTHNTGTLQVSVFENGNIGHLQTFSDGDGVKFNGGADAMYSAGIIFGTASRSKVCGQIGSFSVDYDLIKISGFNGFYALPPDWDQVADMYYSDRIATDPYGMDIYQTSYSNSGDDFMYLRYRFYSHNSSGSDLYTGIFADWDIGTTGFAQNLGGYDPYHNMAFQYQEGGSEDASYYGIIALNGMSGAKITDQGRYETIRDSAFTWISTFTNQIIDTTGDYRIFIGCGPFSYLSGSYTDVYFCIVAGTDLVDLLSNADAAILKYNNVLKKR
jgi:hypothetical protein